MLFYSSWFYGVYGRVKFIWLTSYVISASTLTNHVLLGRPTGLLPSARSMLHTLFTQFSSLVLITCPYHLSLLLLMTVVIDPTPVNFLNSSLNCPSVCQENTTHPSNHLHLCSLPKFTLTSVSRGLASLL